MPRLDSRFGVYTTAASSLPRQFQSFSQYRCKTAKKSEEEIDFLRSNPKIWNVHSVLNVLHSLVDKSNINRQLEVYTSGGECRRRRSLGSSVLVWGPLPLAVCWPTGGTSTSETCLCKRLCCLSRTFV